MNTSAKRAAATAASLALVSAAGVVGSGVANAWTTVTFSNPVATWAGARVIVRNQTYGDAGWCTYHSRPSGWQFDTVTIPFPLPGKAVREVIVPGAQPTGKWYWVRVTCPNAPTTARWVTY
ncbi:hypothetical protein HWD35_12895 [Tsukamurella tyrosinosolvens]|jgi:hypothetical protein|uniref:Secreted protein n=1 Tax=Tsukamurella tyrosinosolvens TaxID=57704 RepID=A0A1H4XUF7_TSUTY|nr:hypothetical protein [Tsukamurella tyrosinosolvens]AUN41183.1 hypothetical protein ASU32_15200 [Tsukamurella tyrosinosolvens]KXO99936.1 hypothetical protein AXK58_01720 [Tsukamurella tyrosinosolvens]KXP04517.1 hypothetical protein AXK59_14010 [Tsukamurella tyrosinosolvens]KZL97771.1 hypothetical protein AXX05_02210 [Tsukamurella tyrosinosolvens]MCA4995608.1 hypothetical protein [Tsukamurella tyrosinosolvens]